jgi:hypothetical protein
MLSQEIFIFRVPIPLFLLNLFGYINLITDPNSSGYRKLIILFLRLVCNEKRILLV